MIDARLFVPTMPRTQPEGINETVAPRQIFYRLGESEVFEFANKNTVINGQKMIDVIPRMIATDQGFLHVEYSQLDKSVQYELFEGPRYKISCKRAIRTMIEDGTLNLVYSEEYKLPTCIPYVVQGTGKDARLFVNISDFVVLDQYGKYQVQQTRNYNALMAVIFAAAMAAKIVQVRTPLPADLADGMVLVYSAMMERTINSLVHMDPITRDKVRYLSAEFCLIQMYGTEEGQKLFFGRYKNKYFPKLSKMVTDSMDNQFQTDSFDHLSSFIDELKRLYRSMHGLSEYAVFDKWIRLYGSSTSMSVDYIGYHLYTICMVLFESPLITRMALEPVMEKNKGLEMYKRMQSIIE